MEIRENHFLLPQTVRFLLLRTLSDVLPVLQVHVVQVVSGVVCHLQHSSYQAEDTDDLDFADFDSGGCLLESFSSRFPGVMVPIGQLAAEPFAAEPDRKLVFLLEVLLQRKEVLEVFEAERLERFLRCSCFTPR